MNALLEIILGLKDNASGGLRGVTGLLKGMATVGGGILGARVLSGIANGFKSMAQEAFGAVADTERLRLSLESLVSKELQQAHLEKFGELIAGSEFISDASDRAQELLHWTEQLAIKSPFDQAGVAIAFRTAMAYGFTSEQAQRLTEATIDFAAATGGTTAQMNSVSLALGQMFAKGKLAGQEILQLTNAGVNVRSILQGMGFDIDDVSKGLVSADDFFNAFVETMETDFGGAAERQSESFAGLLNTFEDLKTIGLRNLFTGIFEALQPMVVGFADWLQSEGLAKLEWIGDRLRWIVQALLDAGPLSMEFANAMTTLIGDEAGTKLLNFVLKLQSFIDEQVKPFIAEHGPALKAAVTAIGVVFGIAIPVISAVGALIGLLTSPITLIAVAIGLLAAAWTENWGGIRDKAAEVWAFIGPILSDLWDWLQVNIPLAIETLRGWWVDTLLPAIEDVWRFLSEDMMPIWEALEDLLGTALGIAIDVLAGFWSNILLPALEDVWTWIKEKTIPILDDLKGTFSDVSGMIQGVVDWIRKLIDKLQSVKLPSWARRQSPSEIELTFGNTAEALRDINGLLPTFNTRIGGVSGSGGPGAAGGNITLNVYPGPGIDEVALAAQISRRLASASRGAALAGAGYAGG